jgi:hypothetical protein
MPATGIAFGNTTAFTVVLWPCALLVDEPDEYIVCGLRILHGLQSHSFAVQP